MGQLATAQLILDLRKVLHHLIIYTSNCNKQKSGCKFSYKGFIFTFLFEIVDKILKLGSPESV